MASFKARLGKIIIQPLQDRGAPFIEYCIVSVEDEGRAEMTIRELLSLAEGERVEIGPPLAQEIAEYFGLREENGS